MPEYTNPKNQVNSYPGAKIYHMLKLLKQTSAFPLVQIVVFSIGINNRDLDPKSTSNKQLSLMYKQAKIVFPNAMLYIPLLNFSSNLSSIQKRNLTQINDYISKHFNHIPAITSDKFCTDYDTIHWTHFTARCVFTHWIKHLNFI